MKIRIAALLSLLIFSLAACSQEGAVHDSTSDNAGGTPSTQETAPPADSATATNTPEQWDAGEQTQPEDAAPAESVQPEETAPAESAQADALQACLTDSLEGRQQLPLDESGVCFALTAAEPVRDLKICRVDYVTDPDTGEGSYEEVYTYYTAEAWSAGEGLILTGFQSGVVANLSISYTRADGTRETKLIFQSGEDGSIVFADGQ